MVLRSCLPRRSPRWLALSLLAFVAALPSPATSEAAAAPQAPAALELRVLESGTARNVVEIVVPEPLFERADMGGRAYDVARIPGAEQFGELGQPLTAVAGGLVAVKPEGEVSFRILDATYETRTGMSLVPVQPADRAASDPVAFDAAAYAANELLPRESVTVGEPAIMRDLRVVPLRVYPLQYNAAAGEARILRRAVVEITCSGRGGENVLTDVRPLSRSFEPLYESLVLNYGAVRTRGYENDGRGKYVIITPDVYYPSILGLAEWKHRSGMEVEIAKLSVIGSTAASIKAYLQNAYDSWQVRPDYVLLVGDHEQLPVGTGSIEDFYAKLAGSDYLVDVYVGRLSCDTVTQCDLLVAKTLNYQRTPYMTDTTWFKKGCLIVNEDWDASDAIYFADTWFAYNLLQAEGFAQIDTLFERNGSNKSHVYAAVTNGRVVLNYRGQGVSNWYTPFDCDPNQTNPGYKLPVVVSATCASANFWDYDTRPCETWMRAGTVAAPKGAVGFLATSRVATGVAHLRSVVDQGIFDAWFNLKIRTVSAVLAYGKYRLYVTYGNQTEYQEWNCQADPALDMWTDTPKALSVSHPTTVPLGASNVVVQVQSSGNPVHGATVCAYSPAGVYTVGQTNDQGFVTLAINAPQAGTLYITAAGHNLHPYEGSAAIMANGPYLALVSTVVDDSGTGDGDGVLEPGETAWIVVTLRNDGTVGLSGATGALSADDQYVVVTDGEGAFGTIAAGGGTASTVGNSFRVSASPGALQGHEVSFTLTASGDEARYAQEIPFTLTLPGQVEGGPTGPDAYGYYAYDTGDGWTGQAPVYSWVELVGTGTKITAITDSDDAITTYSLPFTFKYYGTNYTQISTCSNGFVSMGVEDYRRGYNNQIPDAYGPHAMIAPLWDDLNPGTTFGGAGDIYHWHDSANRRYIIQWDGIPHYGAGNPETFQLILLDPAHHPTATGDGIIIFRYKVAAMPGTATVGIENPTQTVGIQYAYDGYYDPNSAPIVSGQAIKFTTEPPLQTPVWLAVTAQAVGDAPPGGDGDGHAEPLETVNLVLTVRNGGTGTASGVTGVLTTSDPGVSIVNGTSSFGNIASNATGTNAGSPFVIAVGATPAGELVEFDLHLSTGGRYDTYDIVTITLDLSQTGVHDGPVPLVFALKQNAPNPFGRGTAIAFDLPAPARTSLTVYTVGGREVATLVNEELPAGRYTALWDGRDASGRDVAAGVYLYRVEAGTDVGIRKMLLIR